MGKLDSIIAERYISTTQAASIIGCTVAQVQAACKQGMLGVKVGKNWILDKTDLDPIPKKRGNPNFHLESYQDTLKEQRREERIAADELEKAIEKKPEKPRTGGIMMGRRRKS